jgi:hypothetical protein
MLWCGVDFHMDEPRRLLTYGVIIGWLALLAAIAIPNFNHEPKEGRRKMHCINNLRMIDGAIQQWAFENNKTNSDTVTWLDLKSFLSRGGTELPHCPSGGTYSIRTVGDKPTCSRPGHVLP